jgi:hypothetical protein
VLKERKTYTFNIIKETELPDGENFYVLLASDKSRHLLPCKYYYNYSFKVGQTINCRIDKINCTGRIFLEPEHPLYKEKETYLMHYIRIENIRTSKKNKKTAYILKDDSGKEYRCIPTDYSINQNFNNIIRFSLLKIKKGIFYIEILHRTV